MKPYFKQILQVITLLLVSFTTNAAIINLSNNYYRSWNTVIYHEIGSSTSTRAILSSNTGSVGPVIETNSTSYGAAYANSDNLSLYASSSVDGSTIDQLGYDYAIAEATTRFEADLVISDGFGKAILNIDAIYNQTQVFNPTAYLSGEQRIRIFDETGDLVLAYLRGVNDYVLDDVILNFGDTYRFTMSSTAYTKVDAGYFASNQRDFSATITAVSAVPLPTAFWLFLSGLVVFISFAKRVRTY